MKNISVFLLIFSVSVNMGLVGGATAADSARGSAALPSSQKPKALDGVGITEKLGAQVSLESLKFKNEKGEDVALGSFFHPGKPVILSFAYYTCPGLCGVVLNGLSDSMRGLDLALGTQYEVVNVSIDSKETSDLALKKRDSYVTALGVQALPKPGDGNAWHFLVGTEENIQALTKEVGFGFKWVPEENQFAHGAGIFVLTPTGKLSRILYGIQYRPSDLKLSLLEASNGKIGTILDRIILFCYQYDPQLRQYSLGIMRVVQIGALITMLILGIYLGLFWIGHSKAVRLNSEKNGIE